MGLQCGPSSDSSSRSISDRFQVFCVIKHRVSSASSNYSVLRLFTSYLKASAMPPALYFGLLFCGCVFKNMPLLQFVLDRWLPHVGALSRVLQLTVISGTDGVSFSAQNVSFSMPVAPTLAPWGTIRQFRGTLEHKKGDGGIQA